VKCANQKWTHPENKASPHSKMQRIKESMGLKNDQYQNGHYKKT
jgi:hypothetical protein